MVDHRKMEQSFEQKPDISTTPDFAKGFGTYYGWLAYVFQSYDNLRAFRLFIRNLPLAWKRTVLNNTYRVSSQ